MVFGYEDGFKRTAEAQRTQRGKRRKVFGL